MVAYLVDKGGVPPTEAKDNVDGKYIKGFIMFRPSAKTTTDAESKPV